MLLVSFTLSSLPLLNNSKSKTTHKTKGISLTDDVRVGRVLEPEVEGVGQRPAGARRAKGRAEESPVGVLLGDQLAVFSFLGMGRGRKKSESAIKSAKRGEQICKKKRRKMKKNPIKKHPRNFEKVQKNKKLTAS